MRRRASGVAPAPCRIHRSQEGALAAPLFATPIVQCICGGLSSPVWVTYSQSHPLV
ncbi:hypothetical protein CBM2625_B10335 [Cupriavidus taiwanensis]|uniref:Uncharacterized protein n=1 Tax=Cupriavidus taiwanensis TaxID=164546 RepID=A0A976B002_9BURK|nr:hypothetical protein CBM2613_B10334 [Cupriavidus taiwanensis]SPA07640.1 hypothetical protein CBM2625_B10335 [Cupriavidus taiwanensis]